jgi:membrane protein YqaA with SNARE-associated domain
MDRMHLHVHLLALFAQTAPAAAPHHVGALKHFSNFLQKYFERFGIWGLAGIALVDSAVLPMPWQPILIADIHNHPATYLLYPLVAALASALGSLVPFYVGRLGGEIFLLGKINRERYERLRDRFERQEFLAIFLPAMGPPPTPIKLFEFCAGVFEMKPAPFLLAIFLGKMVQFVAYAIITHYFGASAMSAAMAAIHTHVRLVLTVVGLLVAMLAVWLVRKLFDRKKGTPLPVEEEMSQEAATTRIVEE